MAVDSRPRSWRYSSDLGAESSSDLELAVGLRVVCWNFGCEFRSGAYSEGRFGFFGEVYSGGGAGLTQDVSSGWPDFGTVGVSGRTNSETPRALLGNLANTVTSRTFRVPTGNGTLPFLAMKADSGIETVLPAGMPAGSEA